MKYVDAIKVMIEKGHNKNGESENERGEVCAVAALCQVGIINIGDTVDEVAMEQYPDRAKRKSETHLRPIAQLSDHPDTTIDDLRVVFEKVDLRNSERV